MSYDLYVVRRDIPEDFWDYGYDPDYDYGCYFNYTYNLGPFFAAYHVRPSTDLDGKTGRECAEIIGHALMRIYLHPLHELRSEYNPRDSDGQLVDWGSVDGAIKWLERVQDYLPGTPGLYCHGTLLMGNSCNMTPAKCIDCGRPFPRGRMYAGPLCRQCYHKRHPQQAARARQNAHERYLKRKALRQRQMPEEPEIDLDDPTLKKFILDCRMGRHGKEDTSWTSC